MEILCDSDHVTGIGLSVSDFDFRDLEIPGGAAKCMGGADGERVPGSVLLVALMLLSLPRTRCMQNLPLSASSIHYHNLKAKLFVY
jgi:hypothetical protein